MLETHFLPASSCHSHTLPLVFSPHGKHEKLCPVVKSLPFKTNREKAKYSSRQRKHNKKPPCILFRAIKAGAVFGVSPARESVEVWGPLA